MNKKLNNLLIQLKYDYDDSKKYVKDQYNKNLLNFDSATYQRVHNVDGIGNSMKYEYLRNNSTRVLKVGKLERVNHKDFTSEILHTKVGFLTKNVFESEKQGRVCNLYEGFVSNNNKPLYVRCYVDRFKNKEPKYDIVIAQINENQFSYAPLLLDRNYLDENFKRDFVNEVEEIYNNEFKKCKTQGEELTNI